MTAAWELTQPHQQGRFEVTIYQMGWRLGGKGASGRGPFNRIEEHGLHLWMGHYHNAFRIMRDCYAELGRDPSDCDIATWQDAFKPDPLVGLTDRGSDGQWQRLMASFPPLGGLPGDDPDTKTTPNAPRTVVEYLQRSVQLITTLIESAFHVDETHPSQEKTSETTLESVQRLLRYGQVLGLTAVLQGLHTLHAALQTMSVMPDTLIAQFTDALTDGIRVLLEPLLEQDTESQYLWEIIDITLAMVRGSLRFNLATDPRGFDAINDYDTREFLLMHGASEQSVNSAFLRGLYDLAFSYEDGQPDRPRMAAGQGLRGGFSMFFSYRGALFWKMQAGMGDIVFSPLYEVLRQRGVRFKFFHKLENVSIAPVGEPAHVTSLQFNVQAKLKSKGEYNPLVKVDGLPCWPSEPLWEQLTDGHELQRQATQFESAWDDTRHKTKTLNVQDDFDFVILGVSIGVIPIVAKEILARDRKWRNMVEHIKTVPTQCFQLWLTKDLQGLGWKEASSNVSSFVEPFDTWADMSHLINQESYPGRVRSIGYFCNVLPTSDLTDEDLADPTFPQKQRRIVRDNAIKFLNRDIKHLWPRASKHGEFKWGLVNQGEMENLEHPFDSQFWTANVNPSDRYVLCLPGTVQFRISPLDETYDNLTITGDWTDCGFNFGCVEAAVMSGRLASHALSHSPPLEDIDGYDYP